MEYPCIAQQRYSANPTQRFRVNRKENLSMKHVCPILWEPVNTVFSTDEREREGAIEANQKKIAR